MRACLRIAEESAPKSAAYKAQEEENTYNKIYMANARQQQG